MSYKNKYKILSLLAKTLGMKPSFLDGGSVTKWSRQGNHSSTIISLACDTLTLKNLRVVIEGKESMVILSLKGVQAF